MTDGAPGEDEPLVTVIGEALIDLVANGGPCDFQARPGGSPFNVAVGLARLGRHTALMARLADNAFGRLLREHAEAEGIDLSRAAHAHEATTLAAVSLDTEARASYDFYGQGTADWQWTAAEAARVPDRTSVLHFGSLASWIPPGDGYIHAAVTSVRDRGEALVSYDPNVRPSLMPDRARARSMVERSVATAHLVKASREDVEWLYPGGVRQAGLRWTELGARLVVVTDGPDGAHAFRADGSALDRPGRKAAVADTVGAGDAFTAGLLSALVRRGLHAPEPLAGASTGDLAAALDEAVLVSALTCERIGADPPVARPRPGVPAGTPLTAADLGTKETPAG
ncbi:fructokinase [Actinacidiphila yanglinensis]|uniref:Fructokinase n=1 Tax=Actinacidiphila yanglinensis TaxID=310779 RepID=A0A1H6BWL1_9ACTN|nr:carbohydrate kinase [Actinacidiphila yanglinensis]SEG65022.1 fructokinase [Actinacidiphila yanglinensis]